MIRLGQFLKLADLIETGGEAKIVIASGDVTVNGEVDIRRGRQLHPATWSRSWDVRRGSPSKKVQARSGENPKRDGTGVTVVSSYPA